MRPILEKLDIFIQKKIKVKSVYVGQGQITSYPYIKYQIVSNTDSDWRYRRGNSRFKTILLVIQFDVISKEPTEAYTICEFLRNALKDTFRWDVPELEVINISSMRDLTNIEAGTTLYRQSIDVTFNHNTVYEGEVVEIRAIAGDLKDDIENETKIEVEK